MDTWEILRSHSTLPDGYDSYENLNAQGTGSGTIVADGLTVELDCLEMIIELSSLDIEAQIDTSALSIEIMPVHFAVEVSTTQFEVGLEEQTYIIEVCDG